MDSVGKKVQFLRTVIKATGLERRVAAEAERAEAVARDPRDREAWPAVTARAVTSLAELVELGLPLVAPGGVLVAWKRGPCRTSWTRPTAALRALRAGRAGGRGRRACPASTGTAWSSSRVAARSTSASRATPPSVVAARSERAGRATLRSVRVAVLSDIHANLAALDAVLAAIPSVDEVWQLGDVVGYGPHPDEVVARLRDIGARGVRGNHDAAARRRARDRVVQRRRAPGDGVDPHRDRGRHP